MQLPAEMRRLAASDRAVFTALFAVQHLLRNSRAVTEARDRARDRLVGRLEAGGPGRVVPVDRHDALDPGEFRRRYLRRGRPVVISGGVGRAAALEDLSFERLRQSHGAEMVKLVQKEGLTNEETRPDLEYSDVLPLSQVLDLVEAGDGEYLRFSPLLEQFPELLDHLDLASFRRLVSDRWGFAFQLFIGGPHSSTPFHNSTIPFLYTQVAGTKRWKLVPNHYMAAMDPPATRLQYSHSRAAVDLSNVDELPWIGHVDHFEAVLEPGDVLFVPSWMWHGVENLSATIGVRCGFMYPPGAVRASATLTFLRVAACDPGPLRWLWYSYVKTNLPQRDDLLLTSRMIRQAERRPEHQERGVRAQRP